MKIDKSVAFVLKTTKTNWSVELLSNRVVYVLTQMRTRNSSCSKNASDETALDEVGQRKCSIDGGWRFTGGNLVLVKFAF